MKYRPEIDGLRAVAVIPVILFHAGFQLFSGGFVGVDVFFVISGYLITTIIITEKHAGTFTLRRFYERRARRILPALYLVTLSCIPFALMWMAPDQLKAFGKSVVAVIFFASNLLFWAESGYFTPAADQKPLLHTWSLAIEEQYYLFFPILMMLLWRFGLRRIGFLLLLSIILSFAVAQISSHRWPEAAFYLIFSRSFELAIGSMAAIYLRAPVSLDLLVRNILCVAGVALIGYGIFVYGEKTPFPGVYALAPTIGAALIILFADTDTIVGRVLSTGPLVAVGLISYSAYLWHQPLFAFYRVVYVGAANTVVLLLLIAVCFVLAYLTWWFVERPARFKMRTFTLMASTAFASIALVCAGLVVTQGQVGRTFTPEQIAQIQPPNGNRDPRIEKCPPLTTSDYEFRFCSLHPDLKRKALLYGDSHASALYIELSNALAVNGIDLILLQNADKRRFECQALLGSYRSGKPASPEMQRWCKDRAGEIGRIGNRFSAEYLFVALRYTFRLFPARGEVDSLDYDNGEGGVGNESYRESFVIADGKDSVTAKDKFDVTTKAFLSLIDSFDGKTVFIGPVPEVGWDVGSRNRSQILLFGAAEKTISTDYNRFKARNQFANRILDAVAGYKGARVIQPSAVFCNAVLAGRCVAQRDTVPLYRDDDHLATEGARLLSRYLLEQLVLAQAQTDNLTETEDIWSGACRYSDCRATEPR